MNFKFLKYLFASVLISSFYKHDESLPVNGPDKNGINITGRLNLLLLQ